VARAQQLEQQPVSRALRPRRQRRLLKAAVAADAVADVAAAGPRTNPLHDCPMEQ
jgi:hypothetical protein